jgi:hypothetical protein
MRAPLKTPSPFEVGVVIVGLIALAACGGVSDDVASTTTPPSTAQLSEVFDVPDGWQVAVDGLMVAQNSADLDRALPTGPRVVLFEGEDTALVEAMEATTLVEDPVLGVEVGGGAAVAITVRQTLDGGEVMRRFVLADAGGSPRLFVLEAPAELWDGAVDKLGEIIGIERSTSGAAARDRDGDGRSDPDEMAIGQDPDVFTSQACFDLVDAQPTAATALTLRGVDLTGADLTGCSLIGANLIGAKLASADLTSADLTMADLTGADLTGARLVSTALAATNLTGADLTDAVVVDANFVGADLTTATPPPSWESTLCPDGTLSSNHQDNCDP